MSAVSSRPPGLVEVVFVERREVGLSFEERVEELPGQPGVDHRFLTVTGIKPGGQAAQDPRMHVGMVVHSIGDQEVHTFTGPEGEAAVQLMQQRPVVFRFWSVPAVDDHHAAMSTAGSTVGSPVSAANSYLQSAAQQQRWQPQPLAPVPESAQVQQLPPMPTGLPQHPQHQQHWRQQQPLVSASSYASAVGPGFIAQIDHDIGALHRAHSVVPADNQLGSSHQVNMMIGHLQASLRKAERDLLQLKHDKDREVAAALAGKVTSSDQTPPTSAYSMSTGQLVQELTAVRLVAQKHEDDAQALREALQAERENSRRLQEELETLREENATLLMMNEELASELEQGLDGDGAAEAEDPAPAPSVDDRSQVTARSGTNSAGPLKVPSVAEQLARLAERDERMPGPAAPRVTESQSSGLSSRLASQTQAFAPAAAPEPEPRPVFRPSSSTGMGTIMTFSGATDLNSHALALLRRAQARNGGAAAPAVQRPSTEGYR